MELQDRLEKAWADEGRYRDTHRTLTFTKRGLEIGNGTIVVKYSRDDWNRRVLHIDGQEERILALLSVAWDHPMPDGIIEHFHNASRAFSKGELSLAHIHLAYIGLQPLEADEENLRLLFMAEGFLRAGVPGNEIRKAWGLGWSNFRKFNPNHYPAGDNRGGQFAPKDGGDGGNRTQNTAPQSGIELAAAQGKDPTVEKKEKFVDRFYQDAQKAANELGVPVENVLGICALESGWGGADPKARFAREGNNFFSQYHPAPYETGWMWNDDKTIKMAKFASISDSVRSFVDQYGHLVKGISDPEKFAAALQNAGKYGIDPDDGSKVEGFVSDVGSTIRHLRPVIERRTRSL